MTAQEKARTTTWLLHHCNVKFHSIAMIFLVLWNMVVFDMLDDDPECIQPRLTNFLIHNTAK